MTAPPCEAKCNKDWRMQRVLSAFIASLNVAPSQFMERRQDERHREGDHPEQSATEFSESDGQTCSKAQQRQR